MGMHIVKEEGALSGVARELLAILEAKEGGVVLGLRGDLGAGKTALTKALARELGISDHVTSPTFVIMKSYDIPQHKRFTTLTHIDAYRIDEERELAVLGVKELILDPARLTVIEWPERVPGLLPTNTLVASLTISEGGERIISYGD